jgi:lysozyme
MKRALSSTLALSAVGLVALALSEGFTDKAVIPIPGDVPTIGFGATQGVKLGDTTTPERALRRLTLDIDQYERAVRQCANVPMLQSEYDRWVDMTYNIGAAAFCRSTMARELSAGNRVAACDGILLYKKAAGKDCSVPANRCMGLWKRRLEAHEGCMKDAAQ